MESINNLPSVLLVRIFSHFIQSEGHKSFLWNVSAVCKYWNELSLTAPIWKDVDASGWKTEELLKLCHKGLMTSTRSLRLDDRSYNFRSDVYDFSGVFVHCENLRQLNLHYVKLSEFSLRDLAKACPRLDSLTLDDVTFHGDRFGGAFTVGAISPIVSTGGKKLKHLNLSNVRMNMGCFFPGFGQHRDWLVSDIAHFCSSLEKMVYAFDEGHYDMLYVFPLNLIGKGCPRLRTLELSYCAITFSNVVGHRWFAEMKSFGAKFCDFQGLDLHMLLKHSANLKELNIKRCEKKVLDDMSISSPDKMEIQIIENMSFESLKFLEDVVDKWKRTLKVIRLCGLKRDVTSVLQSFLNENPHPVVESLWLIDTAVTDACLATFIRAFRSLMHLNLVPFNFWIKFPLNELEVSCTKLRTLKLRYCQMIFPSSKDNYKFQEMK